MALLCKFLYCIVRISFVCFSEIKFVYDFHGVCVSSISPGLQAGTISYCVKDQNSCHESHFRPGIKKPLSGIFSTIEVLVMVYHAGQKLLTSMSKRAVAVSRSAEALVRVSRVRRSRQLLSLAVHAFSEVLPLCRNRWK